MKLSEKEENVNVIRMLGLAGEDSSMSESKQLVLLTSIIMDISKIHKIVSIVIGYPTPYVLCDFRKCEFVQISELNNKTLA